MNINEYNKPIVATIISVLRSLIVSSTNQTTDSTISPPIKRTKNIPKLIIICPTGCRVARSSFCPGANDSPVMRYRAPLRQAPEPNFSPGQRQRIAQSDKFDNVARLATRLRTWGPKEILDRCGFFLRRVSHTVAGKSAFERMR